MSNMCREKITLILLMFSQLVSSTTSSKRIVYGDLALPWSHPYQATLQYSVDGQWYHFCGGSLVAQNKVLTAAHCVLGLPASRVRVGLGWHNMTQEMSGQEQIFTVAQVFIHDQYNPHTAGFPNDIAIVALVENATLNEYVDMAVLPTDDITVDNQACVVSGWGRTSGPGTTAQVLSEATLTAISNEDCATRYNGVFGARIYNSHVCVYEPPRSACSGDSGGPMVCDGYLTGVTSWGSSSCDGSYPSVYVKIFPFLEWIEQHL